MNSTELPYADPQQRRDLHLEESFLQATDNAIVVPNTLQKALFPRLSTQDTGLLVNTGPGAGRLEAVFVPVMTGSSFDNQLHRLYIIAPDNSLLDDYLYRLVPCVRALSTARGIPVTIFVDEIQPFCRRYASDGTFIEDYCKHPLDADVDLVVAHFSSFRSLFFGSGGVHALPGSLERATAGEIPFELKRRDLFYFDESQSYDQDEFVGFVRLVEFLYAEDLDIVVGATTLPEACLEELSFLEDLSLDSDQYQPPRSITTVSTEPNKVLDTIVNLVKERYFESSRVCVVQETSDQAQECYNRLSRLYPQLVFCYYSDQPRAERLKTYALLRELEKEGEGYLLISDPDAIESADIDANLLLTGVCAPEKLIRRAGRCNRRGDLTNGEIIVVGSDYTGRHLPEIRREAYIAALQAFGEKGTFDPDQWKTFIV